MLLSAVGESGKIRRWSPLTRYRALNSALYSQTLLKHMKHFDYGDATILE